VAADSAIVLVGDNPAALEAAIAPMRKRLSRRGWSRKVQAPFLAVFAPSAGRLDITCGLDGHGLLIGDIYNRDGERLEARERGVLGCRRLDSARARDVCSQYWGRYLLLRRFSGEVSILRDPSGGIDCVVWRRNGVTFIATGADVVLDPWLPDTTAIDWSEVAALVRRPGEHRHNLALTGLTPVAAGELRTVGETFNLGDRIWKPAEVYRHRDRTAPPDLKASVVLGVTALAGTRRWVAELSGGLDSAIVAAALSTDQRGRVAAWVNHYVDHREGDERGYARAVARRHGVTLTEVRREGLRLGAPRLEVAADGFRPASNDIDPDYNDDIAERIEELDAWGSLTGQGGDAVFFQMPTLLIGLDEIWERGFRARGEVLHRLSRWLRRPVWPTALARDWREELRYRSSWTHPWLEDLRGVPPAKAMQISALAFCQTFQGPAVRSRRGPCINPLLSQPVMEAGLARSAVDLTWGGRDRAAARAAFADTVPSVVLDRRSKGELGAYYGRAVAEHLPFIRDYLLGGALAEAGLLAPSLEDRLTRDHLLWRGGHSELLSLAQTEAWVRRWRDRLALQRA
jgi:asparagine synthase (glutamine-hydrolysing)